MIPTLLGCDRKFLRSSRRAQVREGIVPNEHGTWQYGRNGWCDGQQVRPVQHRHCHCQ